MVDESTVTYPSIVSTMREASPYIRAHRNETFVVYFAGKVVNEAGFDGLVQDLILLRGIGVKLIIVHGARQQIDARVNESPITQKFVGHLRVTDSSTLAHVKDAVSGVRIELEARFSQAALDAAGTSSALTVSGGNFVIARPAGVVSGVDLHFTGDIRRVDGAAIHRRLSDGEIVLVSPLGYSPTGEVFNLNALDLARSVACEVNASKLVLMMEPPGLVDFSGELIRELTAREARDVDVRDAVGARFLGTAIRACNFGIRRVHLVDQSVDGALLQELFTRDGIGTLVSNTPFDQIRSANIEDIGGILALIEPLEKEGFLVKRSREKMEMEIDHFSVLVREGVTVACGALHPFANGMAELACIAVHQDYRRDGFGNLLLGALERRARDAGVENVFVLTTHASDWFQENGYARAEIQELPIERQALYNVQRNSIVLLKQL